MKYWALLGVAIVCEVIATTLLKITEGFTRPGPSVAVIVGYIAAFYLLSLTIKVLPVGVVYAVWAGVGVAMMAVVGWVLWGQRLGFPELIGISLIIAGVLILNLSSLRTLYP